MSTTTYQEHASCLATALAATTVLLASAAIPVTILNASPTPWGFAAAATVGASLTAAVGYGYVWACTMWMRLARRRTRHHVTARDLLTRAVPYAAAMLAGAVAVPLTDRPLTAPVVMLVTGGALVVGALAAAGGLLAARHLLGRD